jgi:hypothetical protein
MSTVIVLVIFFCCDPHVMGLALLQGRQSLYTPGLSLFKLFKLLSESPADTLSLNHLL